MKSAYCHEKHPPLSINGRLVYGGRAFEPPKGVAPTLLISLDEFSRASKLARPWRGEVAEHYCYPIRDLSVPEDDSDFKLFIGWLAARIESGALVHIGCMGGHGRTGLVLSALYFVMTGDKDAIKQVRKVYCEHAVETRKQVKYLVRLYGVCSVEASKEEHFPATKFNELLYSGRRYDEGVEKSAKYLPKFLPRSIQVAPARASGMIWTVSSE